MIIYIILLWLWTVEKREKVEWFRGPNKNEQTKFWTAVTSKGLCMQFDFKLSPILLKDSHTQEMAGNDKMKRRREKKLKRKSRSETASQVLKINLLTVSENVILRLIHSVLLLLLKWGGLDLRNVTRTRPKTVVENPKKTSFSWQKLVFFLNMLIPNIFTIFVFYKSEAAPKFNAGKWLCYFYWEFSSLLVSPRLLFGKKKFFFCCHILDPNGSLVR